MLDEYLRVFFQAYTYNYANKTGLDTIPVQAVKCEEMYAEEIAREWEEDPSGQTGSFNQEFPSDENWICPNTTEISLLNSVGKNAYTIFVAYVYQCLNAQLYDEKYGIISYADKDEKLTCQSANETAKIVGRFDLTKKLISMYFNPTDYHKTGKMVRTANYETQFHLNNAT